MRIVDLILLPLTRFAPSSIIPRMAFEMVKRYHYEEGCQISIAIPSNGHIDIGDLQLRRTNHYENIHDV